MKKLIKILALVLTVTIVFAACSSGSGDETTTDNPSPESIGSEYTRVKFTMESGDDFVIELYPQYAPETVENFLMLVESGFYDGLTFHRVMEDFMAQTGDPDGDGTGGSEKTIKGEFLRNGFEQNTLSHTRGVVSMARLQSDYDSASSQFFICYSDVTYLDGDYAAFGKVVEGMETVDSFLDVERTYNANKTEKSVPVEPIVIERAEVVL